MKKVLIILITVLCVVGIIISAQRSSPGTDETLTIGALMPLSGHLSVLGENMRNGMELARKDILAQGELDELEIVYEDACDTQQTLNATRKFIHQGTKVIGSAFCLFGLDAVVPVTEDHEMIVFNTAANPESVLDQDFVFSTNFAIRDDARKMVEFARQELGARRLALIHLDSSFGESYRNNIQESLEGVGGELVFVEASLPTDTDFRTMLTKAKAAEPDALVIIHFGIGMGSAVKQARELGLEMPIIGDYEAEDPTVIEFAGDATEGLIISSSESSETTPKVTAFEKRYFEAYDKMPDVLAANAYDALWLQVGAYQACGFDTACMAEHLEATSNYQGVSGSITIDPEDHATRKNTIFKVVRGGKFVELETTHE